MQVNWNKKKYLTFVLFVFALTIATRIIFRTGFVAISDDHQYAQTAFEIYNGSFPIPTNHWMSRVGNNLSIASSYFLFGINEYSIFFASTFFSFLNILLIFALSREILGKDCSASVYITSSILFIFTPLSIYLGSIAHYSQGLTFFMFLSVYFYLFAQRNGQILYYMLSGVSIGIAYLFHSTGIYVFLVFLAHAIFYKKLNKKATFLFFGFLIVFGLENTFYYGSTGQWLYRQKILTQTHFGAENLVSVAAKKTFETVPDNPFKGTLLGDSWILEPFRQLLLNPVNSVIYYLYFVVNLLLIIRKDRNILLLNLLFWPLFLYYSYGSPNPLSYNPLRRLPRYSLPYLIPVTITISYGIEKILIKRYVRYSLIILYILISIFCLSIKGGEMGQRFYQSKFFYDFIKDHPNENYITDKHTYVGLLLLNRYRKFEKIEAIETTKFFSLINDNEFLRQHGDSYLLINSPFIYGFEDIKYDIGLLKLIRSNENKPRRICSIEIFSRMLDKNLCKPLTGGVILKIQE